MYIYWVLPLLWGLSMGNSTGQQDLSEEAAVLFLKRANEQLDNIGTESATAKWEYESNITETTQKHMLEISAKGAKKGKELWKEAISFPWKTFKDPQIRRQFEKLTLLGTAILPDDKYDEYSRILSAMQTIYAEAKVCDFKNPSKCDLNLEPELTDTLAHSRDPEELKHVWVEWRKKTGKLMKENYKKYVALSNEAAKLNNFTSSAEMWIVRYEADDFKEQLENLWQQLKPLYLQMHAYVRRRLHEKYGDSVLSRRGPIPAHLLGNMWAQTWSNILDFTEPYPNKTKLDITSTLIEQGYTPKKIFELAEQFFKSINLEPMPAEFWSGSILEKPKDGRELVCHASAWDFSNGKDYRIKQCTVVSDDDLTVAHHEMGHIEYFLMYKSQPSVFKEGANPGLHIVREFCSVIPFSHPHSDIIAFSICTNFVADVVFNANLKLTIDVPSDFQVQCRLHLSALNVGTENVLDHRIKQCTRITFESLTTAHHEMGHIQYYLQYKNLSKLFRRGANPGFHEAVGDTIALSVNTPKHLHQINLLSELPNDPENDINQQYFVALSKIAFLPFGYLLDQYRWAIFRGEITSDNYNCKWWQLREKYQGVEPPVDRDEDDFDAGAKYHVAASVPYIRYFVSYVLQFQFHRALCQAAGEYDANKPLHKCDIYQSKEAGKLLGDMLKLGSSVPWPDALQAITGQRNMDASALVEFFSPLRKWLETENQRTGEFIGWEPTKRVCSPKKSDATKPQQK